MLDNGRASAYIRHMNTTTHQTTKENEMTTETIQKAQTRQQNASHDYAELRQEACRLARRILAELDSDTEPENVNWGHVGDMNETRSDLRQINDRLFGEGEHAPENN